MYSQPTRSLVTFCTLSNVSFEFHEVSTPGENLSEEYAKINPYQEIPAILHGDYNLWESAAIVTYIADAFNIDNQWYPKDPRLRGRINSYLHWHHQGCREAFYSYLYASHVGPRFYGRPECTAEALKLEKIKFLNYFEGLRWGLSETGYVARTSQASIADIFAYSEVAMSIIIGFDMSTVNSEVRIWYDEIGAIPEVVEAHEKIRKYAESLKTAN